MLSLRLYLCLFAALLFQPASLVSADSTLRFKAKTADLTRVLDLLTPVTAKSASNPILECVLIEGKKGKLRLTTTDLSQSLSIHVEATVTSEGTVALPAKRLASFLSKMDHAEIVVSSEGDTVKITADSASFELADLTASSKVPFPKLLDLGTATAYTLEQATVRKAIRKTLFAASSDETRYVLNGIYFICKEDRMTMGATDGRRLAIDEHRADLPENLNSAAIIPTSTAQVLSSLLQDKGSVRVQSNGSRIAFRTGEAVLISKCFEGNYPSYEEVIPADTKHSAKISREEFVEAIERVALALDEKSRAITLTFSPDRLLLTAANSEKAKAEQTLKIAYEGTGLSIHFNADFLKQALLVLTEKEIELDLVDENSPFVLRSGKSFRYVLMPVRMD